MSDCISYFLVLNYYFVWKKAKMNVLKSGCIAFFLTSRSSDTLKIIDLKMIKGFSINL